MATASPTPMGYSHFAPQPRYHPSSQQGYRSPPQMPQFDRKISVPTHARAREARAYSISNDSSDDEIPVPMKFSALTNAILAKHPSITMPSPIAKRMTPGSDENLRHHARASSAGTIADHELPHGEPSIPVRRVVRLSTTPPNGRRRAGSGSSADSIPKRPHDSKERSEYKRSSGSHRPAQKADVDINTPAPVEQSASQGRAAAIFGRSRIGTGRSGEGHRSSQKAEVDLDTPAPVGQSASQGRGPATLGRSRFGTVVQGSFLKGPARRGRRRMDEEEEQSPQSPVASTNNENINSVLRSKSPPPPTLSSGRKASPVNKPPYNPDYYKVPAPQPNLPSTHDQENEAPPTFKRNKLPSVYLDKMEKIPVRPPVRPASMDMDVIVARAEIERPPLASLATKSQNTPRRPAPPPPPKMSILDAATSTAGAATTSHASKSRSNKIRLNGKQYTRLDVIGRGGSSRVYRVMAENSKFFALKRVSLEDADEACVRGFKGEIDLLEKLKNVERVIRLYDWELNQEKGTLSVLMEMGEIDMAKMLELRLKSETSRFDPSFVRHYWKEMLECIEALHEHDIVHSDLKPHNFVLVQGRLKLIDFGIANAIQTDETVNVHRETQIGTPNYMSPESLMDSNAKPDHRGNIPRNQPKLMKVGKPSDIWALGCMLYQMVYGRAPFAHIQNTMQRCQAIVNWNCEIEYPSTGVGGVKVPTAFVHTLKKCLNRNHWERPTATELLDQRDSLLNPTYDDVDSIPMTEDLLGRILLNAASKIRSGNPTDQELLQAWPKAYFDVLRRNIAEGRSL